ncbi:MAG: hypothetical protein M5R40_14815 [Anaerolineae bacterium]|nr:hypothetical protein [Anaerolineae bacterium]
MVARRGPIAYATGAGVRVYLPDAEPPVTAADGGPFVNLVWSPRGRYLAAQTAAGAWTLYALEGGALRLAGTLEVGSDLAWTADERLIVAPARGGLNLAALGGEVRPLTDEPATSKPFIWGDTVYYYAHAAPGAPGVLTALRLGSDALPETLGAQTFDPSGARWNADGSALVVAGAAGLMLVDPATGQTTPVPDTAGATQWAWGPVRLPASGAVGVLPAALYFLAENAGAAQVWRVGEDGAAPLTAQGAGADIVAFAVAPGGSRLAQVAGDRLTVSDMGEAQPFLTIPVGGADAAPALSPDGSALAYAAGGIWVARVEGEAPPRALIGDEGDRAFRSPRWSPTGTWLLVDVATAGRVEPALLSVTGHGPITFGADCQTARWTVGNKVLCWGAGGLFLITPGDPAQAATLLEGDQRIVDAALLPDGAAVFLQASRAPWPAAVQPVRLDASGAPQPWGAGGLIGAPRLSPEGSVVAGLHNINEAGRGQPCLIRLDDGEWVILSNPERAWSLTWAGP